LWCSCLECVLLFVEFLIDQCDVDEAMIVPARVDTMPNLARIEISHLILNVLLTNNLQKHQSSTEMKVQATLLLQ
jgi:hypothetical protein